MEHARNRLDEERKRAIDDAERKPDLLAGEAGMVVGIPSRIDESAQPRFGLEGPFFNEPRAARAPAPSVPIARGEQDLSFTISVVYELKNPK